MDIALILDRIRHNAAWRDASSYERLVATWDDTVQTCPTEAELEAEWVIIQNESIVKYCYYSYGMDSKQVDGNYIAAAGEILFSARPTDAELKAAFPKTAGSIKHAVATAAVTGDTVTIDGVVLTAGTDFAVGSDVENITAVLNKNKGFSRYFIAAVDGTSIKVSEKIPGNRNTPTAAAFTGTIALASSDRIESICGYDNGVMAKSLRALTAEYVTKLTAIARGILAADSFENAEGMAALKTERAAILEEYKAKAQVITNG